MSPDDFIAKWQGVTLTERASAQEHFIDICRMLGEQTPTEADPTGRWYAFEKCAGKAGGGDGLEVFVHSHTGLPRLRRRSA